MAITYGTAVQDFYLEQVRNNQKIRKARLASLKTKADAEKLLKDLEAAGFIGPQPNSGEREIHWEKFPE